MSRADLDAIDELAAKVTPGPWVPSVAAGDALIAPDVATNDEGEQRHYGGKVVGESMRDADRDFVGHARTLLPALVTELRAAREVVRTAEGLSQRWHDHINFEELGLDDDVAYEQVTIGMGTLLAVLAAYDQAVNP